MSKRCKLQRKYYKDFGKYKEYGKYTDHYVAWLEDKVIALNIPVVVKQSEQLNCDHSWIHDTHKGTKYCSSGCDGFKEHKAV